MIRRIIDWSLSPRLYGKNLLLLLVRLLAGGAMLTHGLAKWNAFSALSASFPDPIGVGSFWSLVLIIGAEVGCSMLVIWGIFTRLAVLPLIFSMLVVIFIVHGSDPFSSQELPLFYLASYLLLFLFGAGRYSLDHLLGQTPQKHTAPD